MDINWCKACDKGLPAPDAVIYLDLAVEDAAVRGNYGEERYEKVDFQIKVREKFMVLKDQDFGKIPWYSLDARKDVETLHRDIKEIADLTIKHAELKPISRLFVDTEL